jgi:glycosyltransferase involved in cell wall biosynthesis
MARRAGFGGSLVKRLHVAIGAVLGTTGGPATYARELVTALDALGEDGLELTVLADRPDLLGALPRTRVVHVPLRSPWAQPWWDNVAIPAGLRRLRADVYHGTKHALPLVGMPRRTFAVVTIHDLAVLAEPETFARAQRLQLAVHLRHAARRADRVICVSRHAAEDVERGLRVSAERIRVVPHGISPRFAPIEDAAERRMLRRRWAPEGAYLVSFVGTAQPRKRVEVAVEAVDLLRREGMPVVLVVAGRRRPGFEPSWMNSPPACVRLAGELSDEELVQLYAVSDVMVSPSSFEGFGFTFAEAMACGCPVIGVDATSVPEVVGDGGLLVERPEAPLVARALARLLRDPEERSALAVRARARAREFSWESAARRTLEAYRR